jgi:HAD superfamily hydrolase (TIGR01549 family)
MDERFRDVQAVFFDVDDTLYDFERSVRHAIVHLREVFPDSLGQHKLERVIDAYWSHYNAYPEPDKTRLINTDPDLFRRTMWAGALQGLALDPSVDGFARVVAAEFQRMRPKHWRLAMYEGASELLDDLRSRYTLGAITNGPTAVQRPKLEAMDWPRWTQAPRVFVSGEFGVRKPDARIFRAAAASADLQPSQCLMVGDAREFDMPSKAIGFKTILFHGPRSRPDCGADEWHPDAIVSSYREIRALLL